MNASRVAALLLLPLAAQAADYDEATWGDSHPGRVVELETGPNTVSGSIGVFNLPGPDRSDGFRFTVPEGFVAVISAEWSYVNMPAGASFAWGWELWHSASGAPCEPTEPLGEVSCLLDDGVFPDPPDNFGGLEILDSEIPGAPRSVVPFLGREIPAGAYMLGLNFGAGTGTAADSAHIWAFTVTLTPLEPARVPTLPSSLCWALAAAVATVGVRGLKAGRTGLG